MARPSRTSGGTAVEMPTYQPPAHPLTPVAQRSLQSLRETHSLRKLKTHITTASGAVTEMAGAINDRLLQSEAPMRRRRARREREGLVGMEDGDEQEQRVQEMKREVEEMTGDMEASTRKLIDIETRTIGMDEVLKELGTNVIAGGGAASRPDRPTQQAPQRRPRRRVGDGGGIDISEDDDDDDVNEEDDDQNSGPMQSFRRGLRKRKTEYENQPQRQKYATHNTYVGFKRIVHDALHPGDDAPPVPHSDTWFPESPRASGSGQTGTRNAGNHQQADADLSDDDIAIAHEKTSLKCPITLLPFRDPVTSKKCPHSFEKEAILSMISQSGARVGGMRRGEGERAVKCPVCEKMLTKDDLYSDHLLMRRVKRLENRGSNRSSVDNSDSDSDDGIKKYSGPKGNQSGVLEDVEDDNQNASNANGFGADIDGFAEESE
ncbi:MAG: hypothetical protein M1816_001660 [Peltula sp. TS41687]|nr:MAG: hypothetical protein M1816_001660 [Peltula sp. TS41687]